MPYTFFYVSIAINVVIFFICTYFRHPKLQSYLIGLVTIGYSLVNDVTLGNQFGLYYYINPGESTLYMVISGVLLYPLLNMVYTMFLPDGRKSVLIYTGCWITFMFLFEYGSVLTKTIVFTGWRPVPWSFLTYVATYLWIYFLYRYLTKRIEPA